MERWEIDKIMITSCEYIEEKYRGLSRKKVEETKWNWMSEYKEEGEKYAGKIVWE
jgi:hypothetical protein